MKCKYLEHQACIRADGQYRMCCISVEPNNKETIHSHTPIEWINSDTVKQAKIKFENNQWPDACIKCKNTELAGQQSMRQKPVPYGPGLSHLDIRIGNSCNLACVMCFPGSSSTLHYEHESLLEQGIESPWGTQRFKVLNWYDEELSDKFMNLPDLREVYFTGGEPMMVKNLPGLLDKLDSSVEVRFNTNGTIFNHKVYEQLKRFRSVNLCFSIDGVGKVNDYIRWGSKWEEVQHNLYKFSELKNAVISIGPTVQILNAYYYDELLDWAKTNNYTVYDNLLMFPEHYNLVNADEKIKSKVPQFKYWHDKPADKNSRELFIKYTNILDNNRGCKIRDYLPEVAQIYGFD